MKSLLSIISEKLVITKDTKEKDYNNSIEELSIKYDFELLSIEFDKSSSQGKQFNYKEYKVSNDLFKTNISDKIVELNDQELKQYANDLNYHFKDILDNKYTIELINYMNYDQVWGLIAIVDTNKRIMAQVLYNCVKSTIAFKILEGEKEAEKILSNVIDYIVSKK